MAHFSAHVHKVLTWSVGLHGDNGSGVWEQAESVTCRVLLLEGVPFKENTVDVHFGAEPKSVPNHSVAGTHLQSRKVAIHEAVYSCVPKQNKQLLRTTQRRAAKHRRKRLKCESKYVITSS